MYIAEILWLVSSITIKLHYSESHLRPGILRIHTDPITEGVYGQSRSGINARGDPRRKPTSVHESGDLALIDGRLFLWKTKPRQQIWDS